MQIHNFHHHHFGTMDQQVYHVSTFVQHYLLQPHIFGANSHSLVTHYKQEIKGTFFITLTITILIVIRLVIIFFHKACV